MARLTMSARNGGAVANGLREYSQAALVRAKAAVQKSKERVFAIAQGLCPRDTNYMVDHMRAESISAGNGWEVGFQGSDFVGKVNPVTGKKITYFYPRINEFGGRVQPAQPCIFPAFELERPHFRRVLREALKPSRGAQPRGKR